MRLPTSIRGSALGLLLPILSCLLLACGGEGEGLIPLEKVADPGWQCNVPFTEVFHHDFSGFFEEDFRVIDNPSDWCAVWAKMSETPYFPPPCDSSLVDFESEVAILAADPNAVWLAITCVQGDAASARARVLVEESIMDPPGCIMFVRPPYPVHVVKVDRVALVATFVRERTSICPAPP